MKIGVLGIGRRKQASPLRGPFVDAIKSISKKAIFQMILPPKHIKCIWFGAEDAQSAKSQRTRMGEMPLTRARDNYTLDADGIHFLMQDGPIEVVCRIGLETLSQLGSTLSLSDTTEIFESGRATIERAASGKYDRTSRRAYEVVTVTNDDLALGAGDE